MGALDNNLADRGIKPFVIGRKNFLFSDTPRGAAASAGMYSIAVTAKANGLNPRKYVQWLLEEMPNAEIPTTRPGLPRLADAVVGIGAGGNQAEAEGRRGGRQDGGRRGIAKTSRSFLDRNGKTPTPRGLSFFTIVFTLMFELQGKRKLQSTKRGNRAFNPPS